MISALTVLAACGSPAPPPPLLLARHPERVVEVTLPESSRPEGRPAPSDIPLAGVFGRADHGETVEYVHPLPLSQVFRGHTSSRKPPGIDLIDEHGAAIPYALAPPGQGAAGTWGIEGERLVVRRAPDDPEPTPGALHLRAPEAADRENAMNPAHAGLSGTDFLFQATGDDSRSAFGVVLPAPAQVTWAVDAPEGAVLDLKAELQLPPVLERARSDGADLIAEWVAGDAVTELCEMHLEPGGEPQPLRCPLPAGEGQLRLRSEPGADPLLDYVVLEEPTVYVPRATPRRVVLLFVDTLRPDHLGVYGYGRPTSPNLDVWAEGATVFEQARSPAPWTLPSARAALSGRRPERWDPAQSLPAALARAGFRGEALVSNTFLARHYGMGDGWSQYSYSLLASGDAQVDDAIATLDRNPDRDLLLMVHFMDVHLPYREPDAWQGRFAGAPPPSLERPFGRNELWRVPARGPHAAWAREYVMGRYDQCLSYLDHHLGRLLSRLDEDDVVVLFSDHGEEFWEHGRAEHGHELYDELLRVPLVVQAPGLPAGRVAAPVSLLDLAPTVLELLGVEPAAPPDGRSLVALARGVAGEAERFAARPQAFGHTLYRSDAWGVLVDGHKWITRDARQRLYDLTQDPDEQRDFAETSGDLDRYAEALSAALERPVRWAWRLSAPGTRKTLGVRDLTVTIRHPQGIEAVRTAYDPLGQFEPPVLEDGVVTLAAGEGTWLPREVFLFPAGDPAEMGGLEVIVEGAPGAAEASIPLGAPRAALDPVPRFLLTAGRGMSLLRISLDRVPVAAPEALPIFDLQRRADLEALGYIEPEE
ncbi:MAG: sulfatase [Alphaproteobacteria bacterium]|nr:sulfatase [Alphaproteobacteria bacterium]